MFCQNNDRNIINSDISTDFTARAPKQDLFSSEAVKITKKKQFVSDFYILNIICVFTEVLDFYLYILVSSRMYRQKKQFGKEIDFRF